MMNCIDKRLCISIVAVLEWKAPVGTILIVVTNPLDAMCEVARRVSRGEADRGLLICGTGIGMCIAANKVKGVRAASCHDTIAAEMCRRHNDANVLCLSADLLGEELMVRMAKIFLETQFEGGRHSRRIEKISKFEAEGL